MADLSVLFTQTQIFGNLASSSVRSQGKNRESEGGSDGFADLFRKASDGLYPKVGAPGPGSGARPSERAGPNREDAKIPEENETGIFSAQSPPGIPVIQEGNPEAEIVTQQVVFVLEGNTDIGPCLTPQDTDPALFAGPERIIPTGPVLADDEDITARMPQEAGQTEKPMFKPEAAVSEYERQVPGNEFKISENEIKVSENETPVPVLEIKTQVTETKEPQQRPADIGDEGSPCPLENKNDAARKETQYPAEREKEDGSESNRSEPRALPAPADIAPERIASTESLAQAAQAAPRTATPATLFDALVESITAPDSNNMEIQLKPEFLGKVAISLALGGEGLEIKIKADEAAAGRLLAGQITQLSESLTEKGVKVSSIDVVYTGVSEHAFGGYRPKGDAQPEESRYTGGAETANINFGFGFTEEPQRISMIDAGLSSIEFRA
ncbi:MAG: flagellar hook-length control protein FliK [Oscillospiraceae bacterium]|nr:flagellar hook-length control protein FliK [Oscillospiraceae bacterium]